jgi:hypothetical protein
MRFRYVLSVAFCSLLFLFMTLAQQSLPTPSNNHQVEPPPAIPPSAIPPEQIPAIQGLPTERQAIEAQSNDELLVTIRKLTDENSVKNELKYESDHALDASAVHARRVAIVLDLKAQK